jgi:protein TonB
MRNLKTFPRKSLFSRPYISPLTSITVPVRERNLQYKKGLQLTLVVSLVICIGAFQFLPKKMLLASKPGEIEQLVLIAEDVPPPTRQLDQPPPPPRPMVPIPSDDDDIPEDLTLAETELDFDEVPPPPPPLRESEDDQYTFIAYDSPPQLVGGFASLQKYLKYPELARLANMEGSVIVGVLVDTEGNSVKTTILKDSGGSVGFEQAAQEALMQVKWVPGRQRDKPVKVWYSIAVNFQLE